MGVFAALFLQQPLSHCLRLAQLRFIQGNSYVY